MDERADADSRVTQAQVAVSADTAAPGGASGAEKAGHYRWTICAMVFFATTINYVDRQVLGLLNPLLQTTIGWNNIEYGYIVDAFMAAYAIGLLVMGRFVDRVGTRIGYAVSIGIWSVAAMSHALVRTVLGFGMARFALGFGESGNFPAGIKTVAEWFPRKERALATGIFNCGTNVGATIAPLVVPWIAIHLGWQYGFLFTGIFSAIWVVAWVNIYRQPHKHPRVSAAELAYIQSDPPEPKTRVKWAALLPHRQTWAFVIAKFLTDPVWWFYLYWLPTFLTTHRHVSLIGLGLPLVVIYNAASVGSIFGGWLAARFLKAGWSVNRARKAAMLVCAVGVVPIVLVTGVRSLWGTVALISLATAAHQGWSANLFTLASDMFPGRAVASVVGIGGFGGAIGGMCIATVTGFVLQFTGSYVPIFVIAGSAYLVALLIVHLLAPRLEPASLPSQAEA
jgi:ACS family hexuronate transporter-like MFS transporter